jgi:hypothetical protein
LGLRLGLAALALMIGPLAAHAQDLQGRWVAQVVGADNTVFDIDMVLGNAEFVVQVTTTVPQGYVYPSGFRGSVFYVAPDQIHFVVTDWDPKIYENVAQPRPPDSTYTILEITGDRLRPQDNLCAVTSASVDGCTNSYRRAA